MGARGQGPGHQGKRRFRFPLGLVSGVELLPALEGVLQGTGAFGAATQAFPLEPVALAADRAALQRLKPYVDHELPSAPFLYVPAHRFLPSGFYPRVCRFPDFITALIPANSKYRGSRYCAVLCSERDKPGCHPVLHSITQ